jgi:xylulose-5-phosphate/fructose-6-phosphate phosphoketolase
MIVLRTPKGWTGPKEVDGKPVEGTWRSHQVPLGRRMRENAEHLKLLEEWLRSYRPEELFDDDGAPRPEICASWRRRARGAWAPTRTPTAACCSRTCDLPDFRDYASRCRARARDRREATRVLGEFPARRHAAKRETRNFRVFGPDETASNRLGAVFEVTDKTWMAEFLPDATSTSRPTAGSWRSSRAHLPGLARGLPADRPARPVLLLRGLHPHRRLDVQPARQVAEGQPTTIPWRRPIASLNYLLTSHVWRQDHNGFSHQDPGFIDHVVNKKADIIRVYLPPDANTLLCVGDQVPAQPRLRQRHRRRQAAAAAVADMDAAVKHCTAGIGIWEWASNDRGGEPDVVMACAGDVPTLGDARRGRCCASSCPDSRCGWSTSST